MTVSVRLYEERDWPQLWPILGATFSKGDTYAFPTDWTEGETKTAWITAPLATFVAVSESDGILGSYFLRPNHLGNAAHTANCGYVVSAAAAGRGVATAMCEHSQEEARRRGFLVMQFNFVVSTNVRAVELWKRLGFLVVGQVPMAFRHPHHGFVDSYVMHKWLAT